MTDIRYLNDRKEHVEGFNVLNDCLKTMKDSPGRHEKFDDVLNFIENNVLCYGGNTNKFEPLYVFSLSGAENQLSQWRTYGSYTIVFDKKKLEASAGCLEKCLYAEEDKKQKAKEVLGNALSRVIENRGKEMRTRINEASTLISSPGSDLDILIEIVRQAALFKNDGFQEEKEFRIVSQAKYFHDESELVAKPDASFENYSKWGMLRPHTDIEIGLDCVRCVQLGPIDKQGLAHESMEKFVNGVQEKWNKERPDRVCKIEITASGISYRE